VRKIETGVDLYVRTHAKRPRVSLVNENDIPSPVIAVLFGGSFYRTAEESNGHDKSIAKAMAEMGNVEEGRKGVYVVVEVGREVTDFVRIFTRPMRAEIALSLSKNIIEHV